MLKYEKATKIFLSTRGEMNDADAEMKEFLTYIENSTDTFAAQAASPLVKEIHKRVTEVKQNKDMEVEYMTLLQRDRENLELGREEGLKEGLKRGSEHMVALTKLLLEENRIEDLKRASEDIDFRKELFEEYGIL